ncbi:MAG TPA: class II fructose-bisphosphate aldolase [Pyrinomonadaceae bacterium]|nr:class II fructose-bisphosphate aldolase [Pyrinomonadaceae bacterium]
MPKLCPSRTLLNTATKDGTAIAALNFYNAETLIAHVRAANALNASIILQTTEATIDYLGLPVILGLAHAAAAESQKPISLHLDHGSSYELAARCIDAGYTSVMIDGSKLPFTENCAVTRRVVNLAHAADVSVEGELGHVGQNSDSVSEDPTETFTRPEDAARFVQETNVDTLAVAVGTAHGFYKGAVRIDFQRLEEISDRIPDTPLVLHGGSGVSAELLRQAIACGIRKINFGTELKSAFTSAVKNSLCFSEDIDLRRTFQPAIDAVEIISRAKIMICSGIMICSEHRVERQTSSS